MRSLFLRGCLSTAVVRRKRSTSAFSLKLCGKALAPLHPFRLATRLFLQKREQRLQVGEAAALTGVGALQGSPPDRFPIAADLPQAQHVCKVTLLFGGHRCFQLSSVSRVPRQLSHVEEPRRPTDEDYHRGTEKVCALRASVIRTYGRKRALSVRRSGGHLISWQR